MGSDKRARLTDRHRLRASASLAVVRAELAEVEALEDEVRQPTAHLRAVLPPAQFRLVWALLDAQERLGLAEQLLAEHRSVEPPGRRGSEGGDAAAEVR